MPLVIILYIHVIEQSRRVNLSSFASVDDLPMVALSSSHLSSMCPAFFEKIRNSFEKIRNSKSLFSCGKLSISFIALRLVQDDLLFGLSSMCPVVRFISTLSNKSWNTEISIAFAFKLTLSGYGRRYWTLICSFECEYPTKETRVIFRNHTTTERIYLRQFSRPLWTTLPEQHDSFAHFSSSEDVILNRKGIMNILLNSGTRHRCICPYRV